MTPSDSRLCSTGWLWIPNPASGHDPRTPGLPGSSVFLSPRAVLTYPGEPNDCTCLCLRHPCWLHPIWKVGHSHLCVSRPSSGSLIATARVVRLPRLRRTDCSHPPLGQLHVSQAFHMVSSSQPTRKTRLGLAHQISQIGSMESAKSAKSADPPPAGSLLSLPNRGRLPYLPVLLCLLCSPAVPAASTSMHRRSTLPMRRSAPEHGHRSVGGQQQESG